MKIVEFKTDEMRYDDECHESAIETLETMLKDLRKGKFGRVNGCVVVMSMKDGSTVHRSGQTNSRPTLIGGLELAKHVQVEDRDPVYIPDDEEDE